MHAKPVAVVAILFICTVVVAMVTARARSSAEPVEENYCHDAGVVAEWETMRAGSPNDPIVIKLYGLREGLCGIVDRGLVGVDEATEIWERERAESVVERFKDDAKRQGKVKL